MLGPFFRVGQEFLCELFILLRRLTARSRACKGTNRYDTIDHSGHHLGTASDKGTLRGSEKEHERARVDHAQGAEDFDGVALARDLEALTQDDLKDVPSLNVFTASQHRCLETLLGEIGLRTERRRIGQRDVGQRVLWEGAIETLNDPIDPLRSVRVSLFGRFALVCVRQHHDHDGFVDMIEYHQLVVETKV